MKRRDFLKLLSVAPIAPGVLAAMPKKHLMLATLRVVAEKLEKADESNKVKINGKKYYYFRDQHFDPTSAWGKEMARLHDESVDEIIISCL